MIRVSIIGSGNVAHHLIMAFEKSPTIQLIQVFARNPENISQSISTQIITNNINLLGEADVYIIAVSDSAIENVSASLPFNDRLVVHTSGSIPIDMLNSKNRRGVFYPLQTFTKSRETDLNNVPLCLESENQKDLEILTNMAKAVSGTPYNISSIQRKALHVAAVFVNNFTNHLYDIGAEICSRNNIPFNILKPLIRETAEKVMKISPQEAQTGPAKRKDSDTIESHLAFLSDENEHTIYKILTQSIQHGKKL